MTGRRLLPALALLLAAGCGFTGSEPETSRSGLSRAQFVEVYVELRRAGRTAEDAKAFEATKAEILARYGTTELALTEFVQSKHRGIRDLQALWNDIDARMTELDEAARKAADPEGGEVAEAVAQEEEGAPAEEPKVDARGEEPAADPAPPRPSRGRPAPPGKIR